MLEIEDVGRDQPVGGRQPALAIGRAIVRHDQVEIEHQPVELLLAQARTVEQHRARLAAPCFAAIASAIARHARIDGQAQLLGDERAQFATWRRV